MQADPGGKNAADRWLVVGWMDERTKSCAGTHAHFMHDIHYIPVHVYIMLPPVWVFFYIHYDFAYVS